MADVANRISDLHAMDCTGRRCKKIHVNREGADTTSFGPKSAKPLPSSLSCRRFVNIIGALLVPLVEEF